MVPYRYDPEHIAPANNAPRCQHIKLSGHRCKAPARRRRRFCHFHERILRPKRPTYAVNFVEDATSLQFAIVEVLRQIGGRTADYKACGLSLYALQIACSNLKGFIAEPELGASRRRAAPAETRDQREKQEKRREEQRRAGQPGGASAGIPRQTRGRSQRTGASHPQPRGLLRRGGTEAPAQRCLTRRDRGGGVRIVIPNERELS